MNVLATAVATLALLGLALTGCEALAPLAAPPPSARTTDGYRPDLYRTVSVEIRGARDRSAVADAFVRALIDRGHRVVAGRSSGGAPSAMLSVVVEREGVGRAPGRGLLDDLRDAISGDRDIEVRYVERATLSARLLDARSGQVLWLGRVEGAVPLESRRRGVAAPALARRLAGALPAGPRR